MDISLSGAKDTARVQFYLGDDTTTSVAEPCNWRVRGRDTADNFDGTLYESNTRASGPSLAAANWKDLPQVQLSRPVGPDGIISIQGKTEAGAGDIVESEESSIFLPVTFYSHKTGLKYPRILHKYDFTGFGTAASDAVNVTLTATDYTQLMYYTVPKAYSVAVGWDVEAASLSNFVEKFITLEDMTSFKPSGSVDTATSSAVYTPLAYYPVPAGYAAFVGHMNALTSHPYVYMGDDTTTSVEEPGWFRVWASDAEQNRNFTCFEAHVDQANVSAVDIGQNCLMPPKPEIRVPQDSRINFGFKQSTAASDILESEASSLILPITMVKL